MHVFTWIVAGLLAGALARFISGGRSVGGLSEILIAGLGAAASGWVVQLLGMSPPEAGWSHVVVALAGAVIAIVSVRLLLRTVSRDAAREGAVRAAGTPAHERFAKLLHRKPVARDPNRVFDEQLTLGQRVSDRLATFGGSWAFLGLFAATMLGWMIFNTEVPHSFDPYPFILLNLVLSCLAAVQAPVILMSQNRQSERDRLDARLDYEVNLKAELEILALHEKLDVLREKAWADLIAIQERQLALLDQIERHSRREIGPGS